MNVTSGMNVPEVREMARLFRDKAQEIKTLMSAIDSKLNNTSWLGADATRFRDNWNGDRKRQLNQVIGELENASQRAYQDAQQQEDASR